MANSIKLSFIIFVFFLFMCFFTLNVSAKEEFNIGPKIELCIGSIKNCHITEVIEKITGDEPIFIHFIILNDGDYNLVCWNHWKYRVSYEHDGKTGSFGTYDIFAPNDYKGPLKYCLPKKEGKIDFYVPFTYYNELEKDKRMHEWILTPELILEKIKCFKDINLKKDYYPSCSSSLKNEGNRLKFEVVPSIPEEGIKIDSKIWLTLLQIIAIVSGALMLFFLYKLFESNKIKRGKWTLLFIFSLIVTFICGYLGFWP